jgi:hypothetical protein
MAGVGNIIREYTEIVRWAWLFLSMTGVASAQWEEADRAVLRLPPNAFTELPARIMADLNRRGCTIPQVPEIDGLQNVIKGEFAKPGQTDWAVLCSVNRVSSILIFWNGSIEGVSEIEKRPDIQHLQGWGGSRIIFDRHLAPVGAGYIAEHYRTYGGPTPPPLDHQGVDDQWVGKASVVQYFYDGKWLQLTGAD